MINIKDLPKNKVLAYLYDSAITQGMGFLQYDPAPMSDEEAQSILDSGQTYFDYVKGRVMKVDLSKDEFDPWLYDRDNGNGSAHAVIEQLRKDLKSTEKILKPA